MPKDGWGRRGVDTVRNGPRSAGKSPAQKAQARRDARHKLTPGILEELSGLSGVTVRYLCQRHRIDFVLKEIKAHDADTAADLEVQWGDSFSFVPGPTSDDRPEDSTEFVIEGSAAASSQAN